MSRVWVSGSFDDLRSPHVRFLQEAAKLGPLHVQLWPDEVISARTGRPPKFPQAERLYMLQAVRYVQSVKLGDTLREVAPGDCLAVTEQDDTPKTRRFSKQTGLGYHVISGRDLAGFPDAPLAYTPSGRKRIIITGTFDWLHSGHVRFFEEIAGLGDLIALVGHDANIRLLKGEGHPLFPQAERLYMVQSIRYVSQTMLTTGHGWLDAEPELERLKPDAYAVNEDGDKPEKRAYCATHGIEYLVLQRAPKEGLASRSSTELRGF